MMAMREAPASTARSTSPWAAGGRTEQGNASVTASWGIVGPTNTTSVIRVLRSRPVPGPVTGQEVRRLQPRDDHPDHRYADLTVAQVDRQDVGAADPVEGVPHRLDVL